MRVAVVGPGARGARLEESKAHMKKVLREAGVPTADFRIVRTGPEALSAIQELDQGKGVVVKTDWLAAGKGVTMAANRSEAMADAERKLADRPGGTLVIEERLEGVEASVMFLCDGSRAVPLPVARDYKRLETGDGGPNTGGMGAFCPVPKVDWLDEVQLMADHTLFWLWQHDIDYRGVLYAGVMLTAGGRVLYATAVAANVAAAREQAYRAVERIQFEGMQFRSDIAAGV